MWRLESHCLLLLRVKSRDRKITTRVESTLLTDNVSFQRRWQGRAENLHGSGLFLQLVERGNPEGNERSQGEKERAAATRSKRHSQFTERGKSISFSILFEMDGSDFDPIRIRFLKPKKSDLVHFLITLTNLGSP